MKPHIPEPKFTLKGVLITATVIFILLLIFMFRITRKEKVNMVPVEQFRGDFSTDYRYLFRDEIEDEKRQEEKYRKDPFRE